MSKITSNLVAGISKLFANAIFYKPTSSKILSLTIDDVGGDDTLEILDAIDRFNQDIPDEQYPIRATFFIISGKIDGSKILDEILNRGHEIGNHGHEDHFHTFLCPDDFKSEIDKTHEILISNNTMNAKIKWFRPGRALYNSCMFEVLKEMSGYYDKFALASMLPLDTFPMTNNPNFTIGYVSQFIFPGSILLLHGGSPERTKNTVKVLSALLTHLRQQEYKVVTLSELWKSE